jgi:DNA helicase HerA-like ATPase
MTDTPASKDLTESLLRVIRQQRHYGARVIISTQEPTISPRLIDLCSITVIHRFSSPEWFDVLRRHIFILDEQRGNGGGKAELFKRIRNLGTGEALVFAPSAVVREEEGEEEWRKVSEGVLNVKVRKRLTWDGGTSAVCI